MTTPSPDRRPIRPDKREGPSFSIAGKAAPIADEAAEWAAITGRPTARRGGTANRHPEPRDPEADATNRPHPAKTIADIVVHLRAAMRAEGRAESALPAVDAAARASVFGAQIGGAATNLSPRSNGPGADTVPCFALVSAWPMTAGSIDRRPVLPAAGRIEQPIASPASAASNGREKPERASEADCTGRRRDGKDGRRGRPARGRNRSRPTAENGRAMPAMPAVNQQLGPLTTASAAWLAGHGGAAAASAAWPPIVATKGPAIVRRLSLADSAEKRCGAFSRLGQEAKPAPGLVAGPRCREAPRSAALAERPATSLGAAETCGPASRELLAAFAKGRPILAPDAADRVRRPKAETAHAFAPNSRGSDR